MTDHTYQVIVRGKFDGLTAASRTTLLRESSSHDMLSAKFTEEGTFTYDESLLSFTFRYLVSAPNVDTDDKAMDIAARKATAFLNNAQHGYRDLKPVATDLAEVRIRRRS